MIIDSKNAETKALLDIADMMCVAARTAPKARGIDHVLTCVITGEDLLTVADEMDRLGREHDAEALFSRDSQNVRDSEALVMIGAIYRQRGLKYCQYCHFESCADCAKKNGVCVYDNVDLGIAIGSAVALAATFHADCRVFYTAGKAVLSLGLLGDDAQIAFGIPLSAWGKSPYFDKREAMK